MKHHPAIHAIEHTTFFAILLFSLLNDGIGTLVERQTRLIRLMHLPTRDADSLRIAIATTMGGLPSNLIRSITWDQGIEMARHTDITADLGVPVYFCDSRSPWQLLSFL